MNTLYFATVRNQPSALFSPCTIPLSMSAGKSLAYIRSHSLVKMYMIIDEARNPTPHEVKTIIIRAGEQTKIVFTCDIYQIDHPCLDSRSNGLSYLIEKMQGQPLYAILILKKEKNRNLLNRQATFCEEP